VQGRAEVQGRAAGAVSTRALISAWETVVFAVNKIGAAVSASGLGD
jgi:hypothetical protein